MKFLRRLPWLLTCLLVSAPGRAELRTEQSSHIGTYWKAGERPHGWTGPGGQYVQLPENSVARLYLVKGEQDYRLLNPNGWEETEGKH